MFAHLAARAEGAFVPFLMLGDPDAETCLGAVDALIDAGANALELGIPFSDPVADGPVIQAAAQRALAADCTPATAFALITKIRARHPDVPIGLLLYANLVAHAGLEVFYTGAAAAGVDSVLVADVPTAECLPFCEAARAHGIAPVLIAPPDANDDCIDAVARHGSAYTYVLGRVGVTGATDAMQAPAARLVEALRRAGAPAPLVGFGLSAPAHMRAALTSGAAGGIVGSALVHRLHTGGVGAMAALAGELKIATRAA
jgi:tryptophan synthase alpha chain